MSVHGLAGGAARPGASVDWALREINRRIDPRRTATSRTPWLQYQFLSIELGSIGHRLVTPDRQLFGYSAVNSA